jgi:hypothetical protein
MLLLAQAECSAAQQLQQLLHHGPAAFAAVAGEGAEGMPRCKPCERSSTLAEKQAANPCHSRVWQQLVRLQLAAALQQQALQHAEQQCLLWHPAVPCLLSPDEQVLNF